MFPVGAARVRTGFYPVFRGCRSTDYIACLSCCFVVVVCRLLVIPKFGPKPAAERGADFHSQPLLIFRVFVPETTALSKVTSVTSPDPDGTYAPGDVITVWVTFDRYVSVVGDPVFNLNTGKGEPGRADYAAGSGSQARANAQQGLDAGDFARFMTAKDKPGLAL